MSKFLSLKNKTLTLIDQSYKVAVKLGYKTSAEKISDIKKMFLAKQLMIVTVGEARRGKSSLLNALLNEKEPLFPVDINVCTNVVTVVKYGEQESVTAVISTPDGNQRREKISRAQIEDYVSEKGNPNNYKMISLLEIAIPNELLREGVVFVDTPGVGSLNAAHAETTYSFLPNADIVLFVSDSNAGYTVTELDFMKRSYSFCKNMIFPVTKIDTNAGYQEIVDDDKVKITEQLGIEPEDIQIVPVSNMAKLRYLATGNKVMYLHSNYKALENAIWGLLARTKAEIMLMPFLRDLKEEIDSIHNSVTTQLNMLTESREAVNELMQAYDREIKDVKRYQDEGADWKNELNYAIQQISLDVNRRIQEIGITATDKLESVVAQIDTKICKEENYQALLMDINEILALGSVEIRDYVENVIAENVGKIRDMLDLDVDVNSSVFEKLQFVGSESISIEFRKRKKTDVILGKGSNIGRDMMGGSRIGAILGGIIGGVAGIFVGNPIGGVIIGSTIGGGGGSVLGGTKGVVDALKEKHDAIDVNTVKREMSKYINNSVKTMSTNSYAVMLELKKQVLKSFDTEFKQRVATIKENADKIKSNINTADKDIPKKKAMYQEQLKLLAQLEKAFDTVAGEVAALSDDVIPVKTTTCDPEPMTPPGQDTDGDVSVTYDFL